MANSEWEDLGPIKANPEIAAPEDEWETLGPVKAKVKLRPTPAPVVEEPPSRIREEAAGLIHGLGQTLGSAVSFPAAMVVSALPKENAPDKPSQTLGAMMEAADVANPYNLFMTKVRGMTPEQRAKLEETIGFKIGAAPLEAISKIFELLGWGGEKAAGVFGASPETQQEVGAGTQLVAMGAAPLIHRGPAKPGTLRYERELIKRIQEGTPEADRASMANIAPPSATPDITMESAQPSARSGTLNPDFGGVAVKNKPTAKVITQSGRPLGKQTVSLGGKNYEYPALDADKLREWSEVVPSTDRPAAQTREPIGDKGLPNMEQQSAAVAHKRASIEAGIAKLQEVLADLKEQLAQGRRWEVDNPIRLQYEEEISAKQAQVNSMLEQLQGERSAIDGGEHQPLLTADQFATPPDMNRAPDTIPYRRYDPARAAEQQASADTPGFQRSATDLIRMREARMEEESVAAEAGRKPRDIGTIEWEDMGPVEGKPVHQETPPIGRPERSIPPIGQRGAIGDVSTGQMTLGRQSVEGERYEVVDSRTGRVVFDYSNKTRANNKAEQMNQEYGAHRYVLKRREETPEEFNRRAKAIFGRKQLGMFGGQRGMLTGEEYRDWQRAQDLEIEYAKKGKASLLPPNIKVQKSLTGDWDVLIDGRVYSWGYKDEQAALAAAYQEAKIPPDKYESHAKQIWRETGWFRGLDGEWRREFSDEPMRLNLAPNIWRRNPLDLISRNPRRYLKEGRSYTLGDALDHPELFRRYPEFKDIKVERLPDEAVEEGTWGHFDSVNNTIRLKPDLTGDQIKSVIVHEIQHKIQEKEGFALGANSTMFLTQKERTAKYISDKTRKTLAEWLEEQKVDKPKDAVDQILRGLKQIEDGLPISEQTRKLLEMISKQDTGKRKPEALHGLFGFLDVYRDYLRGLERAHETYVREQGEMEARSVQHRMNLSDYRRTLTAPWESFDRDIDQAIRSDKFAWPESRSGISEVKDPYWGELTPEERQERIRKQKEEVNSKEERDYNAMVQRRIEEVLKKPWPPQGGVKLPKNQRGAVGRDINQPVQLEPWEQERGNFGNDVRSMGVVGAVKNRIDQWRRDLRPLEEVKADPRLAETNPDGTPRKLEDIPSGFEKRSNLHVAKSISILTEKYPAAGMLIKWVQDRQTDIKRRADQFKEDGMMGQKFWKDFRGVEHRTFGPDGIKWHFDHFTKTQLADWHTKWMDMVGKTGDIVFDTPEAKRAYDVIQGHFRKINERTNELRAKLAEIAGVAYKPIEEIPNYFPATRVGEYRIVGRDADGNVRGVWASKNMIQAQLDVRKLRKDPQVQELGLTLDDPKLVREQLKDVLDNEAFEAALRIMNQNHPATVAFREAYARLIGKRGYGGERSMMRRFVLGAFGMEEGKSGATNAMKAVETHIKKMNEYNANLERIILAREFASLPGNVYRDLPNTRKYINEYLLQARGGDLPQLMQIVTDTFENAGVWTGFGRTGVNRAFTGVRGYLTLAWLGTTKFISGQAFQAMNALPKLMDLRKDINPVAKEGVSEFFRGMGGAGSALMDGYASAVKPSPEQLEYLNWAVRQGEITPAIVEMVAARPDEILSNPGATLKKATAYTLGTVERELVRIPAMLMFEKALRKAVPEKQARWEMAVDMMQHYMVTYDDTVQPRVYNKLGAVGEMARPMKTYSHNAFGQFMEYIQTLKDKKDAVPLATYLGTQILVGGLKGMILLTEVGAIIAMLNNFFQQNGVDMKIWNPQEWLLTSGKSDLAHAIGDTPSDIVLYGVASALTGRDMSHTVGAPDVPSMFSLPAAEFPAKIAKTWGTYFIKGLADTATQGDRMNAWLSITPNQMKPYVEGLFMDGGNSWNPAAQHGGNVPIPGMHMQHYYTRTDSEQAWANFWGAPGLDETKARDIIRFAREDLQRNMQLRINAVQAIASRVIYGEEIPQELLHKYFEQGGSPETLMRDIQAAAKRHALNPLQQKMDVKTITPGTAKRLDILRKYNDAYPRHNSYPRHNQPQPDDLGEDSK